jgi:hypothetical protein
MHYSILFAFLPLWWWCCRGCGGCEGLAGVAGRFVGTPPSFLRNDRQNHTREQQFLNALDNIPNSNIDRGCAHVRRYQVDRYRWAQ